MKQDKNESLETQMAQLKTIVDNLQKQDTTIQQGIDYFSQGILLAKSCLDILSSYKGKITELKKESDQLVETEFVL